LTGAFVELWLGTSLHFIPGYNGDSVAQFCLHLANSRFRSCKSELAREKVFTAKLVKHSGPKGQCIISWTKTHDHLLTTTTTITYSFVWKRWHLCVVIR